MHMPNINLKADDSLQPTLDGIDMNYVMFTKS